MNAPKAAKQSRSGWSIQGNDHRSIQAEFAGIRLKGEAGIVLCVSSPASLTPSPPEYGDY
jgi:hypothetical protein